MKRLILMIQFLTRIPLPFNLDVKEDDFTEGVIFFPVVGALIGLLTYGVVVVFEYRFSSGVLAMMVIAFQIFITGGLHLDGLADTFDGLYSNRPKERILEIMKDSRIGSNGALILIVVILLKLTLMVEVIESYDKAMIIILTPAFARYTVIIASRFSRYAREKGMGNFFIGKTKNDHLIMGTIFVLAMSMFKPINLLVLAITAGFAILYSRHAAKKIDGITGDILGCMVELAEVLILLLYLGLY